MRRGALIPPAEVQRVAAARRICLQQVLGRQIGEKLPSREQINRRQGQRQRRPSAQGSARTEDVLHHPDGGAGQDQDQFGSWPKMVPHHLHDAGESRRRPRQIGNFVQNHQEGAFGSQGREKLQRRFPGRKSAASQMRRLIAEVSADRLGEAPQLDRLGLLGGAEEHGSLALREVGQQERLAHPPASPSHEQLRSPVGGAQPGRIEAPELRAPIHERCEHTATLTPIGSLVTMLRGCKRS